MSFRFFIIVSFLFLGLVTVGIVFSNRGLLDFLKLRRQVNETRARVQVIEEENRHYARQLELLENPSHELLERQLREELGLARPGEIVYFENTRQKNLRP